MRPWVRAANAICRRAFGVEPRRVGRELLVTRADVSASERRDALAELAHEEAIRRLLQAAQPNCLVDVGANRGQFASMIRRLGYEGRIVSFEPLPEAFAVLSEAAAADPEWTAVNVALGSEEGTADFNVSPSDMFSSLLPRSDYSRHRFGDKAGANQTVRVEIRRLDRILPELLPDTAERRFFLKLDTQGYDVTAFRGLGALQELVVALQSEVAVVALYEGVPHFAEAVREYEQTGLRIVDLFPVSRDEHDLGAIELDCLMWRPD